MAASGFASADVVYDSLCITDDQSYQGGAWSYCGGEGVYGKEYDVQIADDMRLDAPYHIDRVTVDFVTFLGLCPDAVCVSLFSAEGESCMPSSDADKHLEINGESVVCEEFDDFIFGLQGVRITVVLDPILLEAGRWFICTQPRGPDFGGQPYRSLADCGGDFVCDALRRDGGERNPCCAGSGIFGDTDWKRFDEGGFQLPVVPMRIEGIPAGDCVGGERVTAACKPGEGERLGKVVVKVRGGQAGGNVTALLDPPDPRHVSIPLDTRGRGKGKFRDVDDSAAHRVFLCDAVIDVPCGK
ncbi:MAG: hypothetical protein EDS66_14140 [Planctomycetota bacterium]|nr:MAG: hypothetical protein EDS66_14140 [Planctomycetota bacterium]MCQ3922365.1 hypothetical protein [Planctomycetota bacterium]